MTLSIEILVHISGPNRCLDDARYRREARGLLGFETVRRHEVLSIQEKDSGASKHDVPQSLVQTEDKTPIRRPVVAVNDLPSSLLGRPENTTPYGATASRVGVSPFAFLLPRIPGAGRSDPAVPRPATSLMSQLLVEQTPAPPRRHTTPAAITPTKAGPSHRRTKSDSWMTPPSVIPDSQPTRFSTSGPQILSSPCLKRPFVPSPSPSPTRESDQSSWKRQYIQQTSATRSAREKEVSSDDLSVIASSAEAVQETPRSSSSDGLPLEIHPPRPHSSAAQFKTHLTSSLQTLSEQLPLAKYFKPCSQSRPTDKLERGHWFIPINAWDEDLKSKVWQFLTRFVGEGRAGWGVWCSWELQGNEVHTGSSKENRDPEAMQEVVQVYCWGEVIGEVWLVLFLASERRVKGVGAKWIDAKQEIIVQMN